MLFSPFFTKTLRTLDENLGNVWWQNRNIWSRFEDQQWFYGVCVMTMGNNSGHFQEYFQSFFSIFSLFLVFYYGWQPKIAHFGGGHMTTCKKSVSLQQCLMTPTAPGKKVWRSYYRMSQKSDDKTLILGKSMRTKIAKNMIFWWILAKIRQNLNDTIGHFKIIPLHWLSGVLSKRTDSQDQSWTIQSWIMSEKVKSDYKALWFLTSW